MQLSTYRRVSVGLVLGWLGLACQSQPVPFDVLLRDATLYDGDGGPGVSADIGLRGDRIAAIGDLSNYHGRRELPLGGLAVAPGFINMLSWAVESFLVDPRALSDISQGVTLEVFGEGLTMGPLTEATRAEMLAEQSHLRFDIPWTTLGEYLQHLEDRGVALNVASFVGAATVRMNAMGHAPRDPTPAELEQMCDLVEEAMLEGALGVSSALIYAPGLHASTEELIALCQRAAKHGGRYATHLRSEGVRLEEAVEEAIRIGREAGVGVEIYHLKAAGEANWGKLESVLDQIESARTDGLDVAANMYTYTAAATGLDASMPPWVQAGGREEWMERLRDPDIRARVAEEMRQESDEWENLLRAAGSPERVLLVEFASDALAPLVGRTLAEVSAERSQPPEETAIDLVVEDGSRVGVVYFLMSEANLRMQVSQPWMAFASDGSAPAPEPPFTHSNPHPRAYGNFARVFANYVRDDPVLTVGEAVRRLTSLPADRLGIAGRGRVTLGHFADLVIFDPELIQDHATFDDPHQLATGVQHVFVNGQAVFLDGEPTGATPGRFVRGPGGRE